MSLVFDNPLDFLKYAMYYPIRSESKLRLNQSLIMASQPTPPDVLPQKWGFIQGLTSGIPE